jgi:long-subunit fatty acid transport protein
LRVRRVRLEIDGGFEAWSSLRSPTQRQDVATARAGVEAALVGDWLSARAGYAYEPAATPPANQVRSLPDLDRHRLTVGASACADRLCVDVAYAHSFGVTLAAAGGAIPGSEGRYEASSDVAGFALRIGFDASAAAE